MSDSPFVALHQTAETVRQQLGVPTYDADAVGFLARFIEAQRPPASAPPDTLTTVLGCFLGQCLVETYGGQWAAGPDGTTGVGLGGHTFFNPFYLVSQQLTHGRPKSVADFFASVPSRLASAAARSSHRPS